MNNAALPSLREIDSEAASPSDSQRGTTLNTKEVELTLANPVRTAREEDIEQIHALISTNADHLLPRTRESLRELLPYTYVVEERGEILGSTILEIYSPKIAEIRSLVVRDDCRGRGFGKLLVEAAVAEAKRQKIHEILVVTASPKFFEQLNFGSCLNERYALFYDGKSS